MRHHLKILLLSVLCLWASGAIAKTQYGIKASFESVNYLWDRQLQSLNDQEIFSGQFSFAYDNEKNFSLHLIPRFKIDVIDPSNNRYIPDESYLQFYGKHFDAKAGLQLIHWGVSNSFEPSNIVNRKDWEGNFYEPDRLGELVASFSLFTDKLGFFENPNLTVLAFPVLFESPLPDSNTRFAIQNRAGVVPYSLIEPQDKLSAANAFGGALKVDGSIKRTDVSAIYYHGPDRDPGYVLTLDGSGALRLQPFYYLIDMLALNVTSPLGHGFALHNEATYKITSANDPRLHVIAFQDNNAIPDSYFQNVFGIDKSFESVFGNKGKITLTGEYMIDSHQTPDIQNFRPFQNDLFAGVRIEFENRWDTKIEMGFIKDLSNREWLSLTKVQSHVINDHFTAEIGTFLVHRDSLSLSPVSFFRNNSYFYGKLTYAFDGILKKK